MEYGYFQVNEETEKFSFYMTPKFLFQEKFKDMSYGAKLIYGLMLDRMSLSVKNKWSDKQGRVYIIFKNEEISKMLNCCVKKVIKLISELKAYGLITIKRLGQGKPNLIYIKKLTNLKSENNKKAKENKIHIPKEETKKIKKVKQNDEEVVRLYRDIVKKNISYNNLTDEYDKNFLEIVDELIEIMIEILLSKSEYITVSKNKVPISIFKSRILKFDMFSIKYILESLENTSSEIKNIKAYLITTLFNCSVTKSNYYSQKDNTNFKNNYNHIEKPKNKFINFDQPKVDFKKLRELEIKWLKGEI